jgi:hypothetical protein
VRELCCLSRSCHPSGAPVLSCLICYVLCIIQNGRDVLLLRRHATYNECQQHMSMCLRESLSCQVLVPEQLLAVALLLLQPQTAYALACSHQLLLTSALHFADIDVLQLDTDWAEGSRGAAHKHSRCGHCSQLLPELRYPGACCRGR